MQVSVVLSDNKFHVQCNIIKVTGNTDVKHFGNKQPLFLLIYITLFTNNQYNLVFLVETTSLAFIIQLKILILNYHLTKGPNFSLFCIKTFLLLSFQNF